MSAIHIVDSITNCNGFYLRLDVLRHIARIRYSTHDESVLRYNKASGMGFFTVQVLIFIHPSASTLEKPFQTIHLTYTRQ